MTGVERAAVEMVDDGAIRGNASTHKCKTKSAKMSEGAYSITTWRSGFTKRRLISDMHLGDKVKVLALK